MQVFDVSWVFVAIILLDFDMILFLILTRKSANVFSPYGSHHTPTAVLFLNDVMWRLPNKSNISVNYFMPHWKTIITRKIKWNPRYCTANKLKLHLPGALLQIQYSVFHHYWLCVPI